MNNKEQFPVETILLPSKGLVYPKSSVLSKGELTMRYMRAVDEDILTNMNYIEKGIVLDKLLENLIVENIDINELVFGDKNCLLFAARILGYGKNCEIKYIDNQTKKEEKHTIDLTKLNNKEIDESLFTPGVNEFSFTLPSNTDIKFKLLTGHDEDAIEKEINGLKKIDKTKSYYMSTRLKYTIIEVKGDRKPETIRNFVDNMSVVDSRAFRQYYNEIAPDINTVIDIEKDGYVQEGVRVNMNLDFFWPDREL